MPDIDIQDPLHRVMVFSSKSSKVIYAYLPQSISLSVSSDWAAPFAESTDGGLSNLLGMFGGSLKTQPLTAQRWQGSSPIEITLPLVFFAESSAVDDVLEPVKQLMKTALPSVDSENGTLIPPGPVYASYLVDKGAIDQLAKSLSGLADTALEQTQDSTGGASTVIRAAASTVKANQDAIKSAGESIAKTIKSTSSANEEKIDILLGNILHFENVVITGVSPTLATQQLHHTGAPLKAEAEVTFRTYTVPTKEDIDRMFALSGLGKSDATAGLSKSDFDGTVTSNVNNSKSAAESFSRNLFG